MQNRPTPVIGVCAAYERASWSFWRQDAAIVADSYVQAVRRAGGLPVALIPVALADGEAEALLERVDGLLLVGGADLDPAVYGAEPSPRTEATVPLRDRFEIALARAALARDLPLLGICRGLQIVNAATGGTLHQHLLDVGCEEHRPAPGRLDGPTEHEVELTAGSRVAAAAGGLRQTVNSHHHQGVADVGAGGRVTARAVGDGVVEAIEWPACRHAVGVQWHPEAIERSADVAALVEAAAQSARAEAAA